MSQINARVRHKRDTSSNWTTQNPVLLDGEIIIVDTDSGEVRFKIGDGVKTYTQLPFQDEVARGLISENTKDIGDLETAVSNRVEKVSGKGLSTNDYTTAEKNKLAGISTGAEVNQNAFSNVVVGSTTITADSKTDSLTIAAGTGISVSGDATNDKVTITNSGVRSISAGSTNGTISVNTNGSSADVAVKGLGSAAYTASTAYDSAGTAQTKANAALNSAKAYTEELVSELDEGFTSVIQQMYGSDMTEDGAPTIRQIAADESDSALDTAKSYTDTKVAALVDSSPDTLNTLNELAAALGDDPNFATTVATQIGGKVDKVSGKGLSTNDYTTAEKNKLSGIASGAEVNQNAFSSIKFSQLLEDDFVVSADSKTDSLEIVLGANLNLDRDNSDASAGKVFLTATDTLYYLATSERMGLMSTGDKVKLDGIETGANKYTHPTYTSKSSGLYKITVDGTGHVSAATAVTKSDITGLGIPSSDTNTHYTAVPHAGSSSSTSAAATTNGNTYINIVENGARSGGVKITGSGATTVTSDANGVITISSTDNDTKYTLPAATSSALGGVKVGSNITNSSGTISLTKDNVTAALGYTPPTTNTTYSVVSTTADGLAPKRDGSTTKFLRGDGTWAVPPDTNTTYSEATTSAAGLMSASDKTKLNGIDEGCSKYATHCSSGVGKDTATFRYYSYSEGSTPIYSLAAKTKNNTNAWALGGKINSTGPELTYTWYKDENAGTWGGEAKVITASNLANGSTVGAVKTTSTVTSTSGLTACPIISGVPYYKDTKNTYTLGSFDITATAAELNVLDGITATTAELNYVDGVTSNIQTQLNGKLSTSGTAAKATADASGNTITSTYATKSEVNDLSFFSVGTTAPSNTKLLWIDTTATTGGLKYHNGSAWVHVPVAFS